MPDLTYDLQASGVATGDANTVHEPLVGWSLYRTDENGDYAGDGLCRNEGVVTLPNLEAYELVSIRGALIRLERATVFNELTGEDDPQGSVLVQVSTDGGTTWLYWNGVDWVTASASNWTSKTTFDQNIHRLRIVTTPTAGNNSIGASGHNVGVGQSDNLTATARQFRMRLKLVPSSDAVYTPLVREVLLFYVAAYEPEEEAYRTVKRFLETSLRPRMKARHRLASTGTSFTIQFPVVVETGEIAAIYNLTQDPGRLRNILSSVSRASTSHRERGTVYTHTIGLSESATSGDVLEIEYVFSVPVSIGDEDGFSFATVPRIVMTLTAGADSIRMLDRRAEVNVGRGKAWIGDQPVITDFAVNLACGSPNHAVAIAIEQALARTLDVSAGRILTGVLSGQRVDVFSYTPLATDASNVSSGLYVKVAGLTVAVPHYRDAGTETTLITEVRVTLSSHGDGLVTVPIS